MDHELESLLDAYNVQTLFGLALATGILPPKSKKPPKATLLTLLQEQLCQQKRVDTAVAKLNQREKTVLNRLLLHDGPVRTSAFRRELVRADLVTLPPDPPKQQTNAYNYYRAGPAYTSDHYLGDPTRTNSTIFQDVMARLTQQGLVFSQLTGNDTNIASKLTFHPGDELIIPPPLRRHLPKPTAVVNETRQWQPDHVAGGQPLHLLRELYLYWDFVRRNEVALLQSGLVGKRLLRALGQVLLTPEPRLESATDESETGRLYLLRQMLQALKLVTATPGKLVFATPDKTTIPPFWTEAEPTQVTACLRVWLTLPVALPADREAAPYYPQFEPARRLLLKVLGSHASQDWLLLEDLLDVLASQNENYLFVDRTGVERQRNAYYYYGNRISGTPAQLLQIFTAAEQRFVRGSITDLLLPLGLVTVGYGAPDAPQWAAVRLTALGQQVLASLDKAPVAKRAVAETLTIYTSDQQDKGRLVVQPNFQLLAMGPVPLALLAQLDLFAERRKADLAVFEYHLSRESVYQGKQAGLHIDEVITFLQTASGAPLPQNLARSLQEWGAHHERIVFRSGVSLLQVADAATLDRLLAETPIREQVARVLAPGVALVRKGAEQPLLRTLLTQDLLPTLSSDQPTAVDHSVQIDQSGLIKPIHAVPSLYLRGRLVRFAEADEQGYWRLTPATVKRAGGNRKKVLALLEELAKLQRGELPTKIVTLVKQWGAYYGEAGAASVTLLEFRDPQALAELLTHPELQGYLTLFPAGNRALAVVPAKQLAAVKRILQTLGVAIKEGLLD